MGVPNIPICFAQSPPLFTYIGGPKGEALHLSIESSIFGSLHSFNFFLLWANQIQQKKVRLVRGKGQAKNRDEFFWEEKFHVANGKAQAHTEGALHFFLLSLGGGGFRGGYFSVFPGSHYVPFKLPSYPQNFPQVFNVFPNMFSITPHL
jgi:hypothetical protein